MRIPGTFLLLLMLLSFAPHAAEPPALDVERIRLANCDLVIERALLPGRAAIEKDVVAMIKAVHDHDPPRQLDPHETSER